MSPGGLSGPQKAAVLLAQVDTARADRILRLLSESEVIVLMNEMAQLPMVEAGIISQVVGEFTGTMATVQSARQGGPEVAKRLLEERLGSERAAEVYAEVIAGEGHSRTLQFLHHLDASVVAGMLSDEHPQVAALVMTHLSPSFAAQILHHLGPDLRIDMVRRIAGMRKVAHEAVETVVTVLDQRFSALMVGHGEGPPVGGVQALVDILNNSARSVEKQLLINFQEHDPELAEEVRSRLFSFEDVVRLDDVTLQKVLRRLPPKELAVALKTVDAAMRDKFLRNMSERAGADLVEEIELLGPTRSSLVDNAQSQVAKVVRDLESEGEIILPRGEEDLLV